MSTLSLLIGLVACGLLLAFWLIRRVELTIRVPIECDADIHAPVNVDVNVPFETVLTERELDLNQLEIPLDTGLFIDDHIHLETTMPVQTQVATPLGIHVPVKADVTVRASVPIRQTIHVRDRLKLKVDELRIPIRASVPVQFHLNIAQTVRVSSTVDVPLRLDQLRFSLRPRNK